MQNNVLGTVRVLEASRAAGIQKLVYAASSSCYGIASVPTDETHTIDPQYPYALSKYQGEQAVLHWHKLYKLPVNTIRIFNAYGTRTRTTGAYGAVFGVFLKQKLEGKPFTIVGDGSQSRDFIYVTDVARAFFLAAMTTKTGEVFNVGTGLPQTINTLVEYLVGEVIYMPQRHGEPLCTCANIDKITHQLGWAPQVTFESGVRSMINHISDWSEAPLWSPESIALATESWFQYLKKSQE